MKSRYLFASLVSANLLSATLPLYAQTTEATQLPVIQVSGDKVTPTTSEGRKVRPMGSTPEKVAITQSVTTPVSVVDSQDIDRLNAASTLDLLERIPSVSVNRAGGIAGTIFMRGLNSNDMRIPMFVNGDRFRGRNTLQYTFIAPTEIERVEVIRGANSSRFGSDGLSGLVNFVTKRAYGNLDHPFKLNGGEAAMSYQSNGQGIQSTLAVEGAGSGFDVRGYLTHREADNYKTPHGDVPNSDYTTNNGGIVLGYMPDAHQRIEASFRRAEVEDGAPPVVASAPTYSRRDPSTVSQARLAYSGEFSNSLISKVDASLYRNEFDTVMAIRNRATPTNVTNSHVVGPVVYGGRIAATIPMNSAEATIGMDFMDEHRGGAERNVSTATSSTGYIKTGPDEYQRNIGIFADTTWMLTKKLTLTAGARYDWVKSDVDLDPLPDPSLLPAFKAAKNATESATTGSIGLAYELTDVVQLVGNAGTSFRMPWSSEMFSSSYSGSGYTLPNAQLKPEYGTNFDIGTRLHFDHASFGVTAFRSQYRDFLQTITVGRYEGLPATQRQNVGRARIQGVELDGRWQMTQQINLYGNASYVHGTNLTTDTPLPSIAPLSGLMGVQYVGNNQAYAINGEVKWAKGQTRYDAKTEYPTGGYGVVNLTAELQLDRLGLPQLGNTQLIFGVTNLFDKDYTTAATGSTMTSARSFLNPLTSPSRSLNVALRTRF
jgi:hemoglobin/transferrin/lactoferrin receptor protein